MNANAQTMATAVVDGRAIAVMGGVANGQRKTLVWDLATRRQIGQLRCRACLAVATTVVGGRTVAIIGEDMGWISVWDLSTFQEMDYPLLSHPDMIVDAVCTLSVQGLPVAVTRSAGGWGPQQLLAWDLKHKQLLGVPFDPPDDLYVDGMSPFMVDGSPFLATVCEDDSGKQTIRTWDPVTWQEVDVCSASQPALPRLLTGTISTMSVNDWPAAIAPDSGGSVRTFFLFGGNKETELNQPAVRQRREGTVVHEQPFVCLEVDDTETGDRIPAAQFTVALMTRREQQLPPIVRKPPGQGMSVRAVGVGNAAHLVSWVGVLVFLSGGGSRFSVQVGGCG
ncbi:hypothetical protein ACFU9X_37735 [Streptomyces atratus]|uniref:hypothetical protein n=1 Tax=Streptomyces atratus TaxID=1893 RepID=UPI003695583C